MIDTRYSTDAGPDAKPWVGPASRGKPFGPAVLDVEALRKSFNGVPVLTDVSCRLVGGQVSALCGLNGSGKSTLIKILTGVLKPDAGIVRLDGRPIVSATPGAIRAAGIRVIYQDLALFPNLSVADNIAMGEIAERPASFRRRRRARAAALAVLEQLGLNLDPDAALEELTIAERQVVAIACALSGEARLLILDEPTASLTRREADRLFAILGDLTRRGVAILFVSHRYEEVAAVADEAFVLRNGRLVARLDRVDLNADALHEAMTGAPAPAASAAPAASSVSEQVLEVRDLTRAGEFAGVNIVIGKGEIVGLTGLLGAGRTELAQTIFGLRRPDHGEIRVDGRPCRFRSNRDAIEVGVAYLPEDRLAQGLVLEASVADNIALASRGRLANRVGVVDRKATAALVARMIEDLGIKAADIDAPVSTLSGGNQQRVVLAKWLATAPSLLLLDSPTVGVDVTARAAIYRMIRAAAAQGLGVLLISDEVEEVWAHAQRLYVMKDGVVGGSIDTREMSLESLEDLVHG